MVKNTGKIGAWWRRMRPFLTGVSARKQDVVLKAGQEHLDLTLLYLAAMPDQGRVGRA